MNQRLHRLFSTIIALMFSFSAFQEAGAAVFPVTNTNDAGSGSLRQAILDANSNPGPDVIDATGITGTITLNPANYFLVITDDVTITGSGQANLTISGNNQTRIFWIQNGTITIQDLTLANGLAKGGSGGGGGMGAGGAIFMHEGKQGTNPTDVLSGSINLTLINVTLKNNAAQGGIGAGFPTTGGYISGGGGMGGSGNIGGASGGVLGSAVGYEYGGSVTDATTSARGTNGGISIFGSGGKEGGAEDAGFGGGGGGNEDGGFGGGGGGATAGGGAFGRGGFGGGGGNAGTDNNFLNNGGARGGYGGGGGGLFFPGNGNNGSAGGDNGQAGFGGGNGTTIGGGGMGAGGAIFVASGSLNLKNVLFQNNSSTGGTGGNAGKGYGGALFLFNKADNGNTAAPGTTNDPQLTASCVTFAGNTASDDPGSATNNDNVFGNFVQPEPTLTIAPVQITEGNSGTQTLVFTITLCSPAGAGGVSFDIATADGTAQDGNPGSEDNDYVPKSLTGQTIPQGSTTYTFEVTIKGDINFETDEKFNVNVTNVVGATVSDGQGVGTISNDDADLCNITNASFSNISSCNNNGTPGNPADDYYTADLTVNFANRPATGTLRIEPGNSNVLDVVEIAVGSLVGNSHVFTGVRLRTTGAAFAVEVEFSADNACVRTTSAPAVSSCSADVCAISSASFSNVSSCNNNGTPSDPADDYYTADLTVNFSNAPATGILRIEPGNPNVLDVVEIAVGSLVGNSHVFTGVRLRTTGATFAVEVEFSADNACVRTTSAPAVSSCAVTCTAPDITAPTVTQPTCALATGTIVVNATGGGTLEYSINGGTSWFSTNTFSGLAPGNYNIAVRLESNPTCLSTYSGNPIVLTAAIGCNTCVLTCPANIVKNNSWGKCGAYVSYPAATTTGVCGTITYSHPSGSFFPVGTTTVTVSSSTGSTCSFTVTVKDAQKPFIKCPSDIYVTTTTCSKAVTFNVSATDNCPGVTVTTVPASGSVFPVGTTTVTATATDASGNKTTNTFKVKVKENTPPVIHTASSPIVLQWPANGSYQTINVSQFVLSVSDNCSNIPVSSVNIIKVTSDEAEDAYGNADGNTRQDIKIARNCKSVELRRERRTGGNGRVYTIYVSVKDASGNTATRSFRVIVPINQGGTTATDNGVAYTVSCNCDDDDDDWRQRSVQAEAAVNDIPEGFKLEQNIPNPFSSSTIIRYSVPEETKVSLALYNNVGQKVAQLVDAKVTAGYHQVKFESSKLASGIYLYRLESTDAQGNRVMVVKKMIISR
jgi:hypothetical protein